ncbi:MAG: ABC transporter ATP-binding protein [Kiritimatiellia bacterium]
MLLEIRNLSVEFDSEDRRILAVDNVSLTLERGQVLGLVGESGCGKSAACMCIPRLLPSPPAHIPSGQILFDGIDLMKTPVEKLRKIRGNRISVIFQDPMTALSPLHRIAEQLQELIHLHRNVSRKESYTIAVEWLEKVGIPDAAVKAKAWPHELSGGMQQRVMIAMALLLEPDLVIADEPTTALDVTIQAQVLRLMRELHRKESALLLITHDMGVVYQMATHIAVMYAGQIVETAEAKRFFQSPRHPYSQALLRALPSSATRGRRLEAIPGYVPSPGNYPSGCRFHNRCSKAMNKCREIVPELTEIANGHYARCLLYD